MNIRFAPIHFLILILIACLSACSDDESDLAKVKLVELDRENKRLNTELSRVIETFSKLRDAQSGFYSQQVVGQPVKYAGRGETLKDVRERKLLRCGGNADLPGFGHLVPDSSEFVGFDIDFCRAVAAAVLGDQGASQIQIVPLTSKLRFAALQAGEVDVLTRNTTWTMSRDGEMRANYAGVIFYDGQAVMVRADDGIEKLSDFRNKSICVQAGSTSASNAVTYFEKVGIPVEIQDFDQRITAMKQYDEEKCDGYTGDKSSLMAQRTLLQRPSNHVILRKEFSREPLGPLVRHDDDNWLDVVRWTLQCMLNAEYVGLSQANIEEKLTTADDFAITALGPESELGQKIGLSDDFCYQIVRQVGNYNDVYNRHLGPDTDFNLPRGLNALFTDGGLHYPLPMK